MSTKSLSTGEYVACSKRGYDLTRLNTDSEGRHSSSQSSNRERSFSSSSSETARRYADDIYAHSEMSTGESPFPGRNFATLARFLQLPYLGTGYIHGKTASWKNGEENFASLYNLSSSSPNVPTHLNDSSIFERLVNTDASGGSSYLLFLKGYPSPKWLNSIGSTCNVHPEFFQRHLSFWSTAGQEDFFPLPPLSSSSDNIIRLHLTTVGSREDSGKGSRQKTVADLRRQSEEQMAEHVHNLRTQKGFTTGDSIVRHFDVHDEKHFSLQQNVSICVNRLGRGWITLVWLDVGNDIRLIPNAALLQSVSPYNFNPVFLHKPLAMWRTESTISSPRTLNVRSATEQSAAKLHLDYGRHLNQEVAASDSFYALRGIFDFAAYSERALLNMIKTKVMAEIGMLHLAGGIPSISNLTYNKQVLDRHIDNLRDTIVIIKRKGTPDTNLEQEEQWPQAEKEDQRKISHHSSMTILRDYEELLAQAQDLSKKCKHGMTMYMNRSIIEESRRAIKQAQGMEKLTRLAFFYIPLSFTTSFFGMNIKQLNNGSLSIGMFFALSFPVFFLSVCLLYFDIPGIVTAGGQKLAKVAVEMSRRAITKFTNHEPL